MRFIHLFEKVELVLAVIMIVSIPLSEAVKNISFGLLFLCFIILRFLKRDFYLTPLAKGLLFYLATAVIVSFFAMDKHLSFKGTWDILRFSMFYLILINDFRDKKGWLEWSLIAGTVIGVGWGIVFWKLLWHKHQFQILSLGHFNHTAIFLALVLILSLCKLIWDKNLKKPQFIFWAIGSTLIMMGLVLTTSRGSLLGFASACMFLSFYRMNKKMMAVMMCIFIIGGITALIFSKDLQSKGLSTTSLHSRFHIWQAGLKAFKEHPVFGVGLNCFKKIDINYYGENKQDWAPHAHNLYINTLAQMGLIGFIGLLAMFIGFFQTFFRAKESYYKYAAIASLILVLTNGIFNTTLHHEHALAFMVISALM